MKDTNYNNITKTKDLNNKGYVNKTDRSYSFYSKLLNKPFDTVEELAAAEAEYEAAQKAKADAAAQKKADALVVEDAFKALNAARKEYKEKLTQLTTEYAESLENLDKAFKLGKKDIHDTLAAAEETYKAALKKFTAAHPEGYHVTLRDGDFETTISGSATTGKAAPRTSDIFNIFDLMFKF